MNDGSPELLAACRARLDAIRHEIDAACRRVGRDPQEVEILGVTKGHPAWMHSVALDLGLVRVGENRVQDLLPKLDLLPPGLKVQFIGRLQTNKVNKVVGRIDSIASVDRMPLLEKIEARAADIDVVQRIWVQVNISREDQKGGCPPERAGQLWRRAAASKALHPVGLMGMGRAGVDEERLRDSFRTLRELAGSISAELPASSGVGLSMGMSGDFVIAVEEGATQVRLGTALFGPRG